MPRYPGNSAAAGSMGKAGRAGRRPVFVLEERPMLIVLPALALLISGMFVVTILAALAAGREEGATVPVAARRRVL